MPTIKFEITKLTKEQKEKLAKEVTKVAAEITGKNEQAFTVFINEYEKENVSVGGVLLSDK